MKTFIAAVVALSATTGIALAQNGEGQAPQLIGNISANVDARYNDNNRINTSSGLFAVTNQSARDSGERVGLERKFPERYTGR